MAGFEDRAVREFHVSRRARERYGFDSSLFELSGNVVLADFHAARVFAARMNAARDLAHHPEQAVSASQINAMGLIDELLHAVVARYRQEINPRITADALEAAEHALGRAGVDAVLTAFVDEFPPIAVYSGEVSGADYLAGATGGTPNRQAALEELLLLWLANENPAFAPFSELFDDRSLRVRSPYVECVRQVESFFTTQPAAAWGARSLLDLLKAPMRASPDSLEGQLAYIRAMWGGLLGPAVARLLGSLDFIAEESKAFFGFGPGPIEAPTYVGLDHDYEAFSTDLDWMPKVVMLAKNVHVWLDQLSRRYRRAIVTLDQIPEDELDSLARWGFTALWLIGVWERSRASQRIKQMMGDHEAVASAYSLADYRIADDLGGEDAFEVLRARLWRRGIRLSTDMVPNHVGIDSRWVVEHPSWFIGLPYSPFPAYSFNGPDLSDDERVGIYLEDHYFSRSDAAVVFKRRDHWTGSELFIYHGNDGTSMPWNDTAQLDYRKAEVREAVIQTILHVARKSPIIRFDAAMTLAKKHYQRLWFPEPGTGGDIPSRADFGMTRQAFDEVMPEEFWREVVDRVAREAPDTLLLAEAFWLLEGYFVRTLGMHRVYNSAFMNMLRDERNSEYRTLIKNTLEFDPQILKRYVNFMSNPDERTAIDQFGKEDKYFGVLTMMVTLPGLPMFGHGQIEGYAEKYGMEFRRPRWHEEPNNGLIARHERQIFPLLHRRRLFAGVESFLLFDFFLHDGSVDENVFAYTNQHHGEQSLVIYHNRYAETSGWIRTSAAVAVKHDHGEKTLVQRSLAQALGLPASDRAFVVLRDVAGGLEYLRSCSELDEKGLFVELDAYDTHVFLGIDVLWDTETGDYRRLHDSLRGRGIASIEEGRKERALVAILEPMRRVLSDRMLAELSELTRAEDQTGLEEGVASVLEQDARELLTEVARQLGESEDEVPAAWAQLCSEVAAVLRLGALVEPEQHGVIEEPLMVRAARALQGRDEWLVELLGWAVVRAVGRIGCGEEPVVTTLGRLDDWLLVKVLREVLSRRGLDEARAARVVSGLRVWVQLEAPKPYHSSQLQRSIRALLEGQEGRSFLGVNRFDGVLWFRGEAFEELAQCLAALVAVAILSAESADPEATLAAAEEDLVLVEEAYRRSGYRVDQLLEALGDRRGSGREPIAGPDGAPDLGE